MQRSNATELTFLCSFIKRDISSASALRMMLNTCCQFANDHNLLFNPGKTQLVRFSLPSSSPNPSASPTFLFAGQSLQLVDRACHLGHILRSDLSDIDDILRVQTDILAISHKGSPITQMETN